MAPNPYFPKINRLIFLLPFLLYFVRIWSVQFFKFCLLIFILIFACSTPQATRKTPEDNLRSRDQLRKDRTLIESHEKIIGYASYYAEKFHGKKTASGEIFDMNSLTAAHRTLPFGTICKVTNLENNKSVIVRINDRGPFIESRILDLSKGAARAIDGLAAGIIKVKIEILENP